MSCNHVSLVFYWWFFRENVLLNIDVSCKSVGENFTQIPRKPIRILESFPKLAKEKNVCHSFRAFLKKERISHERFWLWEEGFSEWNFPVSCFSIEILLTDWFIFSLSPTFFVSIKFIEIDRLRYWRNFNLASRG